MRIGFKSSSWLASADVGSYYWGIIDWYRPIKVTVEVGLHDAANLFTKTGNALLVSGSGIGAIYMAAEKTIYAVEGKNIYTADSTGDLGDLYKTSYVETTAGVTRFQDWDRKAFVTGFTRLSNVGDSGTARLNCESSHGYGSCTTGTLGVTTELVSVSTVE